MPLRLPLALAVAMLLGASTPASAEWKPVERIVTYAIEGTSGPELYASIGARGPQAGGGRAIAHTNFRLTWKRDYQRRATACVLATAVPTLVITITVPKPARTLSPQITAKWQRFIAGVIAHERVHGEHITAMTRDIEKATVGLVEENDPDCRKIRQTMQPILGALSDRQRAQGREFDRIELGAGGNIERLVLGLVNGG